MWKGNDQELTYIDIQYKENKDCYQSKTGQVQSRKGSSFSPDKQCRLIHLHKR